MNAHPYCKSAKNIARCKALGKAKRIERDLTWFMQYVEKSDGCWEWSGIRDGAGYGFFQIARQTDKVRRVVKMWKAHRYSWHLHFGEIPNGLWVLHRCDNPPCVRPDHLFLGTNRDNTLDSLAKDRSYLKNGERSPFSTISNSTALLIKQMLRDGFSTLETSKAAKVKIHVVNNIKYGRAWRWLTV